MNGPAYALLGLLGCVGLGYIVTVVRVWPQRRDPQHRRWRQVSVLLVISWVVGLACILVFARPGSQPVLTGAVTALGVLMVTGGMSNARSAG